MGEEVAHPLGAWFHAKHGPDQDERYPPRRTLAGPGSVRESDEEDEEVEEEGVEEDEEEDKKLFGEQRERESVYV